MSAYPLVALGEVMVSRGGSLDPRKSPDERFELYSIPAHDQGQAELVSGKEIGSSKQLVEPGDVILSKIVPHIRRVQVVPPNSSLRQIASSEWIVFRSQEFYPPYLRHFLLSDLFHHQFMNTVAGVGGSLLRARPSFVKKIKVALPPLAEQRRIAAILDKATAIHQKRQQALDHLDTLTQSIFHEMFGELPASSTVEEQAKSIRTGPFGSQLLHSEFVSSGIRVLGLDNVVSNEFKWGKERYITNEKYQALKKYTVCSGDVLISIMGTTGRSVVVPQDIPVAINTKHICAITPDQKTILPIFLNSAFRYHPAALRYLSLHTKGSIMAGLNMQIIKATPIPLPPLSFQKLFTQRIESVNKLKSTIRAASTKDSELFASLQARAFRGEL